MIEIDDDDLFGLPDPDCSNCGGTGVYDDPEGDDSASGQPGWGVVCGCILRSRHAGQPHTSP